MLAASVLGSGAVFLEGTVVNVALPAIGRSFGLGMTGLEWVLNGYLLALSALMLLGGSLGDVFGRRRVFALGAVGFGAASGLCALATTPGWLVAARAVQGAAGALLVPNSLAMLEAMFREEDRGSAIGQWAGWSAVSTALGPLAGGWLVDVASWRWVFAAVVPFALAAAAMAGWAARAEPRPHAHAAGPRGAGGARGPGEARGAGEGGDRRRVDWAGAALVAAGLAGITAALVLAARHGFAQPEVALPGLGGLALLAAFLVLEGRARDPLLPLGIFRSRQFSGANLVTLFVYAGLAGVIFLLVVQLQNVLGYSALRSGAALLPVNLLMLVLSPRSGRWARRAGARLPMTLGALGAGAGMALLARVQPGTTYVGTLLPALAVFGLGLGTMVAPLTAAVLAAAPAREAGIASALNNAVARLAGLLATAGLPLAAGLGGLQLLAGPVFAAGFARAMWIGAGLCGVGALVAALTVRATADVHVTVHPASVQACIPCARREA